MPMLFESQLLDESNETDVYGAEWQAQVFRPAISHLLTEARLRLYRVGTPGTITVSLRAVSGGAPTGSDLATASTYNGDTLTTNSAGEIVSFAFATPYSLLAEVSYAFVIRVPSGDINNILGLRIAGINVGATNPYTRGDIYGSQDSGATWSLSYAGDYDLRFEEWGTPLPQSGHLWIETTDLHYIDASDVERLQTGTLGGATGALTGHLWVEGNDLRYIDSTGAERGITGTAAGATGALAGHIWVESATLRYIDSSGVERGFTGTAV